MEKAETRKKGEVMKADREEIKETKNLYLRRSTMKATRLTLIGLAVAALIIGGCSQDNRILDPNVESESNAARIAVRDDGSAQEQLSITARVLRTEVEGGCWYLSTENGDSYTPLPPKSLTLKLGMVLKAEGYVDKNIVFFCGFGPAFVIEEYKILSESEIAFADRTHKSGASDSDVSSSSAQDATSVQKFDKKLSISDSDAGSKPTDDGAVNKLATNDAPQSAQNQKKKKIETSSALTEDRAPAKPTNEGAADRPSEDKAPQATEYLKKKMMENETSGVPTEDRAPAKPANNDAADRPSEDKAPQATEYVKKKIIESETSGVPAEDRAPLQPANDGVADRPTEDRAPQKYEAGQKDVEMKMHFSKPVPIIFNEAASSGTQGINTLEGYTHYAKGGCLMLTASNKEVFEIQHDTDAVLKEGYYIRVTGYISTLAVVGCENAPVFYAETLRILSRPAKSDLPASDEYVPTNEAPNPEYIEEEGVMHRAEPEGACWYFENDNGDRFELLFSNQVSLRSGMRLKVKGVLVNVSTFCGSGKPLQVAGWEVINENKF